MARAWLLALALVCAACPEGASPTQVMVVVAAEKSVADDTARLVVRVGGKARDSGAAFETSLEREFKRGSGLELPLSITIAPAGGDEKRIYEFVATAFDAGGARIGEVRAISGFIKGRSLLLTLLLEESCRTISCESRNLTCQRGDCVDAHVDQSELGSFDPDDKPQDIVDDAVAQLPPGDEMDPDGSVGEMDGSMPEVDAGHDAGLEPCEEDEIRDGEGNCIVPPECEGPENCGPHGLCIENKCSACEPGWLLSGTACVDIDECAEGLSGCGGTCQDSDGSFSCTFNGLNCQNGTVHSEGQCVDLFCSYYVRIQGPDARVRYLIDRSGSTDTATGTGTRLERALIGVLQALDDPYYMATLVSVDMVPDVSQESMCGGTSSLEIAEGTASNATELLPPLVANLGSGGQGAIRAGLLRAQDLPSGSLLVVLFDGPSTTCNLDNEATLTDAVNVLATQGVKVLPIGLTGGMTAAQISQFEVFIEQLALAGGTNRFARLTNDPAEMATAIQRATADVDDCTYEMVEPPAYVGPLDGVRLIAGGQRLQGLTRASDGFGGLKVTLTGAACELARFVNDEPIPTDWYLGYSCSDP